MTKISLAVGRWHSVSLAFVRLVQGLHQTCSIFTAIIHVVRTNIANAASRYKI